MQSIDNFVFESFAEEDSPGEPKIIHSYVLCIANVFKYLTGKIDPVWLMGSSGFAFRIFFEETMCPSAMSMFDFSSILPEAIEQLGRRSIYIERLFIEKEIEEKRREEAHAIIVKELNRNIPAIVWDIYEAEWGIITGYNDEHQIYECFTNKGIKIGLPYINLGMNGIDILSVAIPGKRFERDERLVVTNSLVAAVNHADGKEYIDGRPRYQNGWAAYKLWIKVFERWAWLIESGKSDKITVDIVNRAKHYSEYHYFARTYAYKYLNMISGTDVYLNNAYNAYLKVADNLEQLWKFFNSVSKPRSDELLLLSGNLRSAMESEEEGIEYIRKYLKVFQLNP
ncbi:MAG: hypothetical protein PVF17_10130 [Ignavibacteria bacterium]